MKPAHHGIARPTVIPAVLAAATCVLYLAVQPRQKRGAGAAVPAELVLQLGHTAPIKALAFSPDGSTLASGSEDCTIKLWDPQTGELKQTLIGPQGEVNALAYSPDGKILAGGGNNGA